ncbi:hypothetical protein DDZ13_09400 [Coraliomargarita sinensis]|uniref:Uncharacterized protein n=1 Tax=Coraliomargarita sinensis TaxID=2174842 RepID=A0A317ZIW8_9BACT|nr:hypothetical protein [Coraliomargarita sinensis]PXA03848.1 hypothetical protein DDZ13_09400 [Coraliomargarita sinensis]
MKVDTGNKDQDDSENHTLNHVVGSYVTVYLKRNDLGMAGNLPMSANSGSLNGAKTTLLGRLVAVHDDAIVLRLSEPEMNSWIPLHSILHVMYAQDK